MNIFAHRLKAEALFNIISFCKDLDIEVEFVERNVLDTTHYYPKKISKRNPYTRAIIIIPVRSRNLIIEHDKTCKEISWDICHELGHYLIATPARRKRKDYRIPNGKPGRSHYWCSDDIKATLISRKLMSHFNLIRGWGKNLKRKGSIYYKDSHQWFYETGFSLTEKFINNPKKFIIK